MAKIYLHKSFLFIVLVSFVCGLNTAYAQAKKGDTPKGKTTTTPQKTATPAKTNQAAKPANTKNIKARGIIAADMDCLVKVNGSAKLVNATAYTAKVVMLVYGINTIEATSTDKKNPASFRTTIDVKDTTKQIIEISFFDDKKFLDYVKEGRVDMVETAIKKNPDLTNNEGQILVSSPLQLAIVNSQPDIVKLLVKNGAKFNSPEYIYPMHKAAIFASSQKPKDKDIAPDREMIEFFLTKGCKLNEKDEGGNTLLHAACRGLKLDLVMFLLDKGLDIDAKNDFGDTPLKIAEAKGGVSIINYLKSKGAKEDKLKDSLEEKSDDTSSEK